MRFAPLMLLIALPLCMPVHAVETDAGELDEHALAKMAKSRAKAGVQDNRGDKDAASLIAEDSGTGGKGLSNCGINIGNSVNSKPGQAPKEIIVVVKGDVINANNRCK